MRYGKLIVTKKEFATLRRLLREAENKGDSIYTSSIAKFMLELRTARIVEEYEMPQAVIRLHSIVAISTPYSKDVSFQIVLPDRSNIAENKLSIMAPMGLALFGYAEGDKVYWEFPSGINKITILKVTQPEAGILYNKASALR